MESRTTLTLYKGASARILPGAVSTTLILTLRVISVAASAILAPVAYLQCAAGNPSLPVILGAATAILAGMALSHCSRKGGEA